ncbi:GIY-YIG nuclease family protein [Maribacter sp. ANRC-HE7]|uniref:GIY-YIG nuclease family protein n=1 Tax=Maribacter aquimaris TaxID=2737171 RepID=A0ABR7V3J3_9FLAO|nr:GIY-YIG nuclease family protein [Maribacter aquimaris]MBD0779216.1 GIY-YIG nuclease family protein [Maribacter aquimaris]
MKYFTYILYSEAFDTFYKGQTNNVLERLHRHNSGREKTTARYRPWKLVWFTEKKNRADAMALERKLKNLTKERTKEFIAKYSKDAGSDV